MRLIKTIAIDFDNTITYPSEFPITGEIRQDAIKVLKKLKQKYTLLLWTARTGKYLDEAIKLLKDNQFEFHYINRLPEQKGEKPDVDLFIDDRNFDYEVDWSKIEQKLLGGKDAN